MWEDKQAEGNPAGQAAQAMLDAFTSVGAESFDVTWTTRQGEKADFRRHVPAATLRHFLPSTIASAEKKERNIIVRPVSRRAVFIQLDDLSQTGLERVKPAAFLGLETSPGNYQAWVALPVGAADKDFARRLRKGAGADDTASGRYPCCRKPQFQGQVRAGLPKSADRPYRSRPDGKREPA